MAKEKLILLGLNEINFEYIEKYIQLGYLPTFQKIFTANGYLKTTSEKKYELLEPWIQWVTIHTGKTFDEHQVFRLGDIVNRLDLIQLWEIAESKGLTVAAISPFNASNKLKKSAFFVPDPWTKTTAMGEPLIIELSKAVSSAVNGNAHNKLTTNDAITIVKSLIKFVPFKRKLAYITLLITKLRKKATKAIILDNLLADVFVHQWKKHQPDFSSLFLNSGAHTQHHYMFNSRVYDGELKNPAWYCPLNDDPILDTLMEYDLILSMLLSLNTRIMIATGLHQKPHLHNTYYWRLTNHRSFLDLIGITNGTILPRMSRDFLVNFNSKAEAEIAEQKLNSIHLNGVNVFTVDNRTSSLFVELTYANEIVEGDVISLNQLTSTIDLKNYVSFVAIKNGEHDQEGYFIDTATTFHQNEHMHLKDVFSYVTATFN
jgi:hypothetical protein